MPRGNVVLLAVDNDPDNYNPHALTAIATFSSETDAVTAAELLVDVRDDSSYHVIEVDLALIG
jgi:hypothetical protein